MTMSIPKFDPDAIRTTEVFADNALRHYIIEADSFGLISNRRKVAIALGKSVETVTPDYVHQHILDGNIATLADTIDRIKPWDIRKPVLQGFMNGIERGLTAMFNDSVQPSFEQTVRAFAKVSSDTRNCLYHPLSKIIDAAFVPLAMDNADNAVDILVSLGQTPDADGASDAAIHKAALALIRNHNIALDAQITADLVADNAHFPKHQGASHAMEVMHHSFSTLSGTILIPLPADNDKGHVCLALHRHQSGRGAIATARHYSIRQPDISNRTYWVSRTELTFNDLAKDTALRLQSATNPDERTPAAISVVRQYMEYNPR